jgi:hypothetical protein
MEYLITWITGTVLLPIFIVAVVASVMGIKPEVILMPLFNLFGVIFKLGLDLAILLVRLIGGGALMMIARAFNVR